MKKFPSILSFTALFAAALIASARPVAAAEPTLRWLGHAAFAYTTRTGKIFLIDPWLSNPKAPAKTKYDRVEAILVTHGHSDHVGEAFEIAKKTKAVLIASYELTEIAKAHGVLNVQPLNPNGNTTLHGVTVTAVPAVHSSSYAEGEKRVYAGAPLGFVVSEEGVGTFYHAGDTGVFSDMSTIGSLYNPTVILLPIGGIYTMTPMEAAYAAQLFNTKTIIPMHYGTFPALSGSPAEFEKEMKRRGLGTKLRVLKPGESVALKSIL